jgi:hypothetical protein
MSVLWAAGIAAAACSVGPSSTQPARPASPLPSTASPTAQSSSAAAAAPSIAAPAQPEASPPPGSDHRSAAACNADADCDFDDPCVPTRCMGAQARDDPKCDESAPAPGACVCLAGRCTLEPREQPRPDGPCEVRGCVVDRAGGRCVADTRGLAENRRSNSEVSLGPSCDCIEPAKGCQYTWHDPVPCRSERDCWVELSPRPHPVPRPRALRGRDFRPCEDGEIPPQCGADGHCTLSMIRPSC